MPSIGADTYCQYKSNLDYYRGKTKSVYEKEPMFQDFVNNIPLSERNMYDADNITRIKHRFNNIMQERWGREVTPDPLKPSLEPAGIYQSASERLALRHKSVTPAPGPLPAIYVYHRNSRRGV